MQIIDFISIRGKNTAGSSAAERSNMTDMIAPPLTSEGFKRGCSQPGPVMESKTEVTIDGLTITFTKDGVLLAADTELTFWQLTKAKEAVGDRTTRIRRKI